METEVVALIVKYASQYPLIATVLAVVSMARVINKPLFSLLRSIVSQTNTLKDDEVLLQVELSKTYKAISYILDWTLSVKLPEKKQVVQMPLPKVEQINEQAS